MNFLISWNGDINGGTVTLLMAGAPLKLSMAYNAVHCVTDPGAVSALLKDKLETDVEKNPGPASQAQRQARNARRKRRRARKRISKIRKLQKEWVKGNKAIATWNAVP